MPKAASYYFQRQMQKGKLTEFRPISGFVHGYRNREDITTLNAGIMVVGSKNVLTSTKGTIGNRKGYTLDGSANKDGHPVLSSYDWLTHIGTERNLRYTNGKLQYRYVDTNSAVTWRDLFSSSGTEINFAEYWDFNNELKSFLLFVDGTSNIMFWTGGVTTVAATTVNTIKLADTGTWASNGFLNTGTFTQSVTINGNVYTYTGGATTDTLTGVAPDPRGEANGSIVHQTVVTTANTAITGIPATFANKLIATVKNQVYVSAGNNFSVYVSKVNNFKDYSFASPRAVSEGAILTLDAVPTALVPQDTDMYIGAGRDFWYRTKFTLSSTNANEALSVDRLKTATLQAPQEQGLATKIKNKIAYASFEPIINTLGLDANILNIPQVDDISSPIVNDINSYDMTGGHMKLFRKNLYIAFPAEGIVRIYNMTQEDLNEDGSPRFYWEAPQTIPVSRFAIIGGELYGHSSSDGETFKLFDGWNDNGNGYTAEARFAYNSNGSRNLTKSSDEFFVEGYVQANTTIHSYLRREYGGSLATLPDIKGTNTAIVGQVPDDASLGKVKLGNVPLGSSTALLDGSPEIPKFRVYLTYPRTPYFEEQVSFASDGMDQRWEIVDFGANASPTTELQADITI